MMSAIQQLIGVILFHGDIHKTVTNLMFVRYIKLQSYVFTGPCTAKSHGVSCSPECDIEEDGPAG